MIKVGHNNSQTIKQTFLHEIPKLYPLCGIITDQQLRDMIFVFAMGWCEALAQFPGSKEYAASLDEIEPIVKPNWIPDKSWRW